MTNLYLICEDVPVLIGAVYLMAKDEYELSGSIHSMNKDIYEQVMEDQPVVMRSVSKETYCHQSVQCDFIIYD